MDNVIQLALIDLIPGEFHPHLENQNDNIDGLVNSIKNLGIIEPLIVRKKEDKYEIINGNRRYNAAKQLNLEKIPVIVINATDEEVLNIIITNNVQRKELTGKEEALLYEKAIRYPNVNVEQLSLKLGIPEDRINSKLKIVKKNENKTNQILTNHNINGQTTDIKNNNIINNDIINLNNLNNEEIRRERSNMNENQFTTPNQGTAPQNFESNQGPTFGGRFFPAMDNPSQINSQPAPQSNQLVDLTGNTIQNQGTVPVPNQGPISNPEIENTPAMNNTNPEPINIPTYNNIPTQTPVTEENNQMENIPTPTLEEIEKSLNIVPESTPSIPETPNLETQLENNTVQEISREPLPELENIPNIETKEATPIKEVTPIINIIKSIVTNMELLGYKINITENEGPTNYNINIEVEK